MKEENHNMKKVTYKVIMPTSIKYLDITKNFIDILKINWNEGYENLVISTIGKVPESLSVNNVNILENKDSTTLPSCIISAIKKYPADFYFIFLGDAFIYKKVNNEQVEVLLNNFIKDRIQYCRLLPKPHFYSKKLKDREYRFLNNRERYGHTFSAFAASKKFIERNLSGNISDRVFEMNYLKIAGVKPSYYFLSDVVLCKNIFQIISSQVLVKGKWNPLVFKRLQKQYPGIKFAKRDIISHRHELILILQKIFWLITPQKLRLAVKQKLKKYFDTSI